MLYFAKMFPPFDILTVKILNRRYKVESADIEYDLYWKKLQAMN